MKRLFVNSATFVLVASIFGVSAWLPSQLMGHAHSHAHHQAATHATPLCTLFCSAGQMAHYSDPTPPLVQLVSYSLELPKYFSLLPLPLSLRFSRGPPNLSRSTLSS